MSTHRDVFAALFSEASDDTRIQLMRYGIVGGLAFTVDFGSLVALTELAGIHYLISAAIAFTLGLATNYALSVVWVFNVRAIEKRSVEFAIFCLIGVVGLGLNEFFIWFFTHEIEFHYTVSKLISTGAVFVWNFIVRKYVLFR